MKIYVVQHTHTDRGFTHRRTILKAGMQLDFLDQAVRLAAEDRDFKWTCETSEVVWDYLNFARPRKDVDAFLEAVKRGQIDVAPHWAHLTFYPDADTFKALFDYAWELKDKWGIQPGPGMITDVNGIHWGVVDLLREMGSPGLISALNTHFGGSPLPKPQLFNWEGPSGNTIPVWLGEHYHLCNRFGIEYPQKIGGVDKVVERMKGYLHFIEEKEGYNKDTLLLQVSAGIETDNSPPGPQLSRNIKTLNDRLKGEGVELKLATATEAFKAILKSWHGCSRTYRGDWPDWWSKGFTGDRSARAARAAGLLRQKKVVYGYLKARGYAKELLAASDAAEKRARFDLLQFCEHSSRPYVDDQTALLAAEESLAYLGTFPHLKAPMSTPPVVWAFNIHPFAHMTIIQVDLEHWMTPPQAATIAVEDMESGAVYPAQMERVALSALVQKPRLTFAARLPAQEPRGFRLKWSKDPGDFDFTRMPERPEGFWRDWFNKDSEYPPSTLISHKVEDLQFERERYSWGYRAMSYGNDLRSVKQEVEKPVAKETPWPGLEASPKYLSGPGRYVPKDAKGPVYRKKVRAASLQGCLAAWVELSEYPTLGWLQIRVTLLPALEMSPYIVFMSVPLKGSLEDLNIVRPFGAINYARDILPGACRSYLLQTGGVWLPRDRGFTAVASLDFPVLYPGGMNIGDYGKPPRQQSETADLYFNLFRSNAYQPSRWVRGSFFMTAGEGGKDEAMGNIATMNDLPLAVIGNEKPPW